MFARKLFLFFATASLAACVSGPRQVAQTSQPPIRPAPERVQPVPPPLAPRATNVVPQGLRDDLLALWRSFPGKTGIAVRRIDGDWVVGHRGAELFPQQSVSKLWVTMAVLEKVDRGELALDTPVTITRDDLTLFHQPLAARVAREGTVRETVRTLINEALTASDNSANDALLRTAGGPAVVNEFLRRKGLSDIRFGPGERLLQSGIAGVQWRQDLSAGRAFQAERARVPLDRRRNLLAAYVADPIDGASPEGIVDALARLARGELLSQASTQLMLDTLGRTRSGPNRLKAGVPAGWKFLHKTGTGQDLPPISTGYNDVGIMTAPDGTRYAVAVMLAETTAGIPQRMQLMQAVSRAVGRWHQL
jgi:beta-lactamase class A